MEEGSNQIQLSRGDLIALSQEISDRDVKYAKLEMLYEMSVEKNRDLELRLAVEEAARKKAEEEAAMLREENLQQREEIETLKAQIASMDDAVHEPNREILQQAIEFLLQKHILLSILQLQAFMENRVTDLNTALVLRAFVLECIPEQLQTATLSIINKVMALPEKQKPVAPIDQRTINLTGDNASYNENNN